MDQNQIRKSPQGTATAPQGTSKAPQGTATAPQGTSASQGTSLPAAMEQQGTVSSNSLVIGETVLLGKDSFRIEKLLGSGSESDVYLVRSSAGQFALKVYKRHYHPNKAVIKRLSPLVGKGYLADVIDQGILQIDGHQAEYDLSLFFSGGPASSMDLRGKPDAILAIAVSTAVELDQCHRLGVLHKDVKPANLLVDAPEYYHTVLCDFGISDTDSQGNAGHFETEQARTPIYAAPEMYDSEKTYIIDGRTYCRLTPAADFYSLGMTLLALWEGESAFLAKEHKLAGAKLNRSVPVPSDIPNPLREIIRGLLVKRPENRWGLREIRRYLQGGYVPVVEEDIDVRIEYDKASNKIAYSLKQLALFMAEDRPKAQRLLYNGTICKLLKDYPEKQIVLEDIVDKLYVKDQETGLFQAILTMDRDFPLFLKGIDRHTRNTVSRPVYTLKDLTDFCCSNLVDQSTCDLIASNSFINWVSLRDRALSNKLPTTVKNNNEYERYSVYLRRIQVLEPLADLVLNNDPNSPAYAMTDTGMAVLLNQAYHIWWSWSEHDEQKLKTWDEAENAPANTWLCAPIVRLLAATFENSAGKGYLADFMKGKDALLKQPRFDQQISWLKYCVVNPRKGPTDKHYCAQRAMMKCIYGFGEPPTFTFSDGSTYRPQDIDAVLSLSRSDLAEGLRHGLRGWFAIVYHENPHGDFTKQYQYEKALEQYLSAIRVADPDDRDVLRFDDACRKALQLVTRAKTATKWSLRFHLFQDFALVFLIGIPVLTLLILTIITVVDSPIVHSKGSWTVLAVFVFVSTVIAVIADRRDLGASLGGGALMGIILYHLCKYFCLYFYGLACLYGLVMLVLGMVRRFNVSRFWSVAKVPLNPGYEELKNQPLEYAFDKSDSSFDSSLNLSLDSWTLEEWRDALRQRGLFLLVAFGITIALCILSIYLPELDVTSASFRNSIGL